MEMYLIQEDCNTFIISENSTNENDKIFFKVEDKVLFKNEGGILYQNSQNL